MTAQEQPIELLETLGVGSFGIACVARILAGDVERTVAVKILKGEWLQNAEVLSRTRDEARLMAILNHPYIVRVEQLITLWGLPAMVMDYVPGASLFTLAKEGGAFPLSVAMTVAQRTALALHAAYHRPPLGRDKPLHVVHRDIKPSNILIGIDGEVKILDFGTARGEFAAREASTRVLGYGSLGYLAPERLSGIVRDPAIDIYSLGVTLYEVISGRRMGNLQLHRKTHPGTISEKLGAVSIYGGEHQADEETRRLLFAMMSYDAEQRPSAAEVAQAAEAILRRIPSQYHVSSETYAREIVEPIYLKREIRPPPEGLVPEDLLPDERERLLAWARSPRRVEAAREAETLVQGDPQAFRVLASRPSPPPPPPPPPSRAAEAPIAFLLHAPDRALEAPRPAVRQAVRTVVPTVKPLRSHPASEARASAPQAAPSPIHPKHGVGVTGLTALRVGVLLLLASLTLVLVMLVVLRVWS